MSMRPVDFAPPFGGTCPTRDRGIRAGRVAAVLVAVLLAHGVCLGVPFPFAPKPRAAAADPKKAFDEKVQEGIRQAQEFLWMTQRPDGTWEPVELITVRSTKERKATIGKVDPKNKVGTMPFPVGTTALCAFALLESGVSPEEPRMARTLKWLAGEKTLLTYSIGLRANVWQAASKYDARYRRLLAVDVRALMRSTKDGGYHYVCPCEPQAPRDNSNSQYGLLGVWAGAKEDMEIPRQYWQIAMQYWIKCQNRDGGWGYRKDAKADSYASMTVAGLASLYVCAHNYLANRYSKCGVTTAIRPIESGLEWLGKNMQDHNLDSRVPREGGEPIKLPVDPYYLFGVERVALASGYRRFGGVDWYRAGVRRILFAQRGDGSIPAGVWGDVNVGTAYSLLFLSRGRHPLVFSKLQFDSDWNNRPDDLPGLTRWLSKSFERTLNWQIIQITDPVEGWHDAPLLYVSGAEDPKFTDEQLDKLRTFVHQGGTLFSITECSGPGFRAKIREAYKALFPSYELEEAKVGHPLFAEPFKLYQRGIFMISNGVRPLAIHCDTDLSLYWQQRRFKTSVRMFQIAANIAAYVTGKDAFAPRAAAHWVKDKPFTAKTKVKIARLKHNGNYDPEPLAYERFRRLLGQRHAVGLEVVGPIDFKELADSGAKLATITGTGKLDLTDDEVAAMKAYVAAGGTVVIDAAGGGELFYRSAQGLLESVYGRRKVQTLSQESKVYALEGMKITNVSFRGEAIRRIGKHSGPPAVRAVILDERPAILLSREDITTALVGSACATCDGYTPESAFELMRNFVVFAHNP